MFSHLTKKSMKASLRIQNRTKIHKNRHCVSMYLFVGLQDQLMPHVDRIVSLQTIIRNVVWNQIIETFLVQIVAILNVVLLRSQNSKKVTIYQSYSITLQFIMTFHFISYTVNQKQRIRLEIEIIRFSGLAYSKNSKKRKKNSFLPIIAKSSSFSQRYSPNFTPRTFCW